MLNPAAVNALRSRIQAEIDDGHSQAAQFALGLNGEVVAAESFGTATADSRFVIFSATKAIVAMSLLPHLADGSVELTAPVARYLPGFGDNGKEGVTVLQLLTMQGGFPQALIGPDSWGSSEGRRRQFAEWTLAWPSGTRTEYHPIAAHWVIAELIETMSGRPYIEVVNERVPGSCRSTRRARPCRTRSRSDHPHRGVGTQLRTTARRVRPPRAGARHDGVAGTVAEPQ